VESLQTPKVPTDNGVDAFDIVYDLGDVEVARYTK
jgi:hypothetical protein